MKMIALVLMPVFSVAVLAVGMPHLETSNQEAYLAYAYYQAQQIRVGKLPVDTLDPWGSPFTVIQDDRNQIVRVVSPGPDRLTAAKGGDADAVDSEMSLAPHHRIIRNKQIQFLIVLGLSASPWIVAIAVLFRSVWRRLRPASNEAGMPY